MPPQILESPLDLSCATSPHTLLPHHPNDDVDSVTRHHSHPNCHIICHVTRHLACHIIKRPPIATSPSYRAIQVNCHLICLVINALHLCHVTCHIPCHLAWHITKCHIIILLGMPHHQYYHIITPHGNATSSNAYMANPPHPYIIFLHIKN